MAFFFFPHFFLSLLLLVGAFGVSARWRRATTRDARPLLSTVIPPTHQPASSLPSFFSFLPGDCWYDGKASSAPPPPPSLACIHIKSHHRLITRPPAVRAPRGPRFALWQRRGLFARKKWTCRAGEISLMVVRQNRHCKYTRRAQYTVH